MGSILEAFWEPSSPLYSFLVAGVANRVPKEVSFWRCVFAYLFSWIFGAKATSRRGVGGEGADLWRGGNIAFGPLEDDITMCFCTFCTEASAKP